jgi:5-formyltetrahydrofolate cyclo-ligase
MTTDLIAAKATLRREMRALLAALPEAELTAASHRIVEQVQAWPAMQGGAACVALFGGIAGEPDLLPLASWLTQRGGTAVYFGFENDELVPRLVTSPDDLERGPFGVWMPCDSLPVISLETIDIVLVPGLAFDRHGGRLGRGRGYFDRLLATPSLRAIRAAVGLQRQVIAQVPMELHDMRMEWLITEQGINPVVPPGA